MIYLYFGVIAVMRVVQTLCNKKTSNYIDGNKQMFVFVGYQNIVSAIIAVIVLFFVGFNGFDSMTLILATSMGLILSASIIFSLEAMKLCSIVLVNMFATAGIFIPSILGIFLFGELMTIWQWVGLAVFMIGTYFIIAKAKNEKIKINIKAIILLILVFITNGAVMIIQKYFALKVIDGNISMFTFLSFGVNGIIFMVLALLTPKKRLMIEVNDDNIKEKKSLAKKKIRLLLIYGVMLSIAIFLISQLITISAQTVPSVILFPVSSAITLIITCFVGVIAFKEKLSKKNILGIIFGILGIVLLNF